MKRWLIIAAMLAVGGFSGLAWDRLAHAFLWGQSVSQKPVVSGPMAIAFVSAADLGSYTSSPITTTSFTVANNSVNELLVVAIAGDNTSGGFDDITAITYGGTALTLAGHYAAPNALRHIYLYYLMHPTTTASTVGITTTNNHAIRVVAAEYSGVAATSPIDGTPVNNTLASGPATMTTSITATVSGEWAIMVWEDAGGVVTGAGTIRRGYANPSNNPSLLDSNGTINPAGTPFNMLTTTSASAPASGFCSGSCQQGALVVAFKPGP